MTNFIKTTAVMSALLVALFIAGSFAASVFAFGESGDGGCCGGGGGYSQADYYSQGNYYSQADYYSQGNYYTQADYYSQSNYYTQSDYYTQGDYYSQGSYSTPAPSCDEFKATPDSFSNGGGQVTLTWKTTNATEVKLDGEIVSEDGSKTVNVTSDKTFTLKVKGAANDAECKASVTVESVLPKCIELTASKRLVEKGEEITLFWKTKNANAGIITPGQIFAHPIDEGSIEVTVGRTTTYVLTVIDEEAEHEHECQVTVEVRTDTYSQSSYYSQGSYGGGGSKSPKCDLDISAKKIKKGKEVTIEWKTSNATDVLLKDNHGKTLIDTDDLSSKDKKEFLDGKIKVRPTKDTTYTLIAEKGSKDDECKVKIEVEDEVVVLETRDQKPFVQGIALTHVPYTGFEAGPVLTFIFYTLLTLWALFVAYVLVIKKKAS